MRRMVVAVALAAALIMAASAQAQEEPTARPTPFGLLTIPVTITLSGPAEAEAGGRVTFTIDYAFSAPHPETEQYSVSFTHNRNPDLRYVSFEMQSGAGDCRVVESPPELSDWVECGVGSASARSGRLALQFEIDTDYVGPLHFGVYMRGTSIRFAEDSVDSWTTEVVASGQESAALSISPTSGGCGTSIDVSGSGFPAESDVIVVAIPDIAIGLEFEEPAATTDADGAFQATIAVPNDPAACPGDHGSDWIVFACAGTLCEPKVSVPFTLTATDLPVAGSGFTEGSGGLLLPIILSVIGASAVAGAAVARVRKGTGESQ